MSQCVLHVIKTTGRDTRGIPHGGFSLLVRQPGFQGDRVGDEDEDGLASVGGLTCEADTTAEQIIAM
jgi:hypothetical protein